MLLMVLWLRVPTIAVGYTVPLLLLLLLLLQLLQLLLLLLLTVPHPSTSAVWRRINGESLR